MMMPSFRNLVLLALGSLSPGFLSPGARGRGRPGGRRSRAPRPGGCRSRCPRRRRVLDLLLHGLREGPVDALLRVLDPELSLRRLHELVHDPGPAGLAMRDAALGLAISFHVIALWAAHGMTEPAKVLSQDLELPWP